MKNLSLDHKTTKDKIDARQTAQEKEIGSMKKGMSDMNKNTNDQIEAINEKLDSHIKGCAGKHEEIKVRA